MKISLLLSSLLFLSSCSFFINRLDTNLVEKKDYQNKIPPVPTYCPLSAKPTHQLVGSNESSHALFIDFIKSHGEGLDFLDQLVLFTLVQVATRPDQSSPTARFQIAVNFKNKVQYFDFFSEQATDQYPLIFGLDWIIKKFSQKKTLETYAQILDEKFPKKLRVGNNFEAFLKSHQEELKSHPILGPYYLRANETLQENERIPGFSFKKLIAIYRKKEKSQKIIVNTSLTPFNSKTGEKGACNYDFNLYDNSIFLIDKTLPVANLFGLAHHTEAFMAATSQRVKVIDAIDGMPLFKGESKVRSSAICIIERNADKIWLYSNLSRDPGQHLFHLIRYGLGQTRSIAEVDKLIRHSRHLFLSDPVRLIIESSRSHPDQIESLLKLNLPIYNSDKLGNIWGYAQYPQGNRFVIDDRNGGYFLCK